MGQLHDLYQRMNITVHSPDKTVCVVYSGTAGIRVKLCDDVRRRHTTESLEHQINAVTRVAIAAYRQAARKARAAAVGEPE